MPHNNQTNAWTPSATFTCIPLSIWKLSYSKKYSLLKLTLQPWNLNMYSKNCITATEHFLTDYFTCTCGKEVHLLCFSSRLHPLSVNTLSVSCFLPQIEYIIPKDIMKFTPKGQLALPQLFKWSLGDTVEVSRFNSILLHIPFIRVCQSLICIKLLQIQIQNFMYTETAEHKNNLTLTST